MQQNLVKFYVVIIFGAGLLASDSVLCTVLTVKVNGSLNYIIFAFITKIWKAAISQKRLVTLGNCKI